MTKKNLYIIASIGILLLIFIITPPVPQDLTYHQFADNRNLYQMKNFWNVISNLPFILLGLIGFITILHISQEQYHYIFRKHHFMFFTGIFLTGFGSAYYHYHPDNYTLVWDRLPMTITFMTIFSLVIGDLFQASAGKKILLPLIFLGIISIFYWSITESKNQGDLRLYIIIQYLSVLLIPVLLFLYKSKGRNARYWWSMIIVYTFAKLFEINDNNIYQYHHIISGHTLKHFTASIIALIYIVMISECRLKNFFWNSSS